MKSLLLSLLLTYNAPADTLHTQTLVYEVSPVNTYPGTLVLTDQAVRFRAKSTKKQDRNFTLAYSDIHRIKRRWQYLFPNRTLIRTRDGKKYTFYTYRRKKMFRIIAAKINRRK